MLRPPSLTPPGPLATQRGENYPRLVELMQMLLGPQGCPWDREQSLSSLRQYVLEEAHEVAEAIDGEDLTQLKEELGDLTLQVLFLSELGRRLGAFGPDDVLVGLAEKLVRRHPHVFGEASAATSADVRRHWETIKDEEKGRARPLLDGIPRSLPALRRAQTLSGRASRVGFDWPSGAGSRAKVEEELVELDDAVAAGRVPRIEHELGDLLFALVNLARHCGVDAEQSLRGACERFRRRFAHVEARVNEQHGGWQKGGDGESSTGLPLAVLDGYWEEAKREGL